MRGIKAGKAFYLMSIAAVLVTALQQAAPHFVKILMMAPQQRAVLLLHLFRPCMGVITTEYWRKIRTSTCAKHAMENS